MHIFVLIEMPILLIWFFKWRSTLELGLRPCFSCQIKYFILFLCMMTLKNNFATALFYKGNGVHANNGKHMNGMLAVASWHKGSGLAYHGWHSKLVFSGWGTQARLICGSKATDTRQNKCDAIVFLQHFTVSGTRALPAEELISS